MANRSGKGAGPATPRGGLRNKEDAQRNEALHFSRPLRELIVERGESVAGGKYGKRKRVQVLVELIWDLAIEGRAWAAQFIAERVEGKVPQVIQADVNARVDDVSGYSDAELEAIIRERRGRRKRVARAEKGARAPD